MNETIIAEQPGARVSLAQGGGTVDVTVDPDVSCAVVELTSHGQAVGATIAQDRDRLAVVIDDDADRIDVATWMRCPREQELVVHSVTAVITVQGRLRAVDLTSNANLSICGADIADLTSHGGRVEVTAAVEQRLTVRANLDVTIAACNGHADLVGASIVADQIRDGELRARRDISIGLVSGRVEIVSTSGNATLHLGPTAHLVKAHVRGELTITAEPGATIGDDLVAGGSIRLPWAANTHTHL